MRALLRPFALHAAYTPIETIVFFCVVGTLAYFHILDAVKHSAFLAPPSYSAPPLNPAHTIYKYGEWLSVTPAFWSTAKSDPRVTLLELQQVVVSLDALRGPNLVPGSVTFADPVLASSTSNFTSYLAHSLSTASGDKYETICYRPSSNVSASPIQPCFSHKEILPRSVSQSFTFQPGSRQGWVQALQGSQAEDGGVRVFNDDNGVKFEVVAGRTDDIDIGQMRSPTWMAYAARAMVMRFWDLAKKADSLDILLILMGYILMHITFFMLFSRSRKLGSNFWLPLAVVTSSVLALLLALPIAMYFRIPINPVALTEALPFLVCTVGFDKPIRLARAVFTHPHLSTPVGPGGLMKPAPKIITESLQKVYPPIIRDYVMEIILLAAAAYPKIGGLSEVCALAALILMLDCLLMCTFLAAVLNVMIEVRRIKTVRAVMTRSRTPSISSASGIPSAMARPQTPSNPTPTPLRHRISTALLGEKGSSLPGYVKGTHMPSPPLLGTPKQRKEKELQERKKSESPVSRLKLLLIATFLTLHILNLITPLTPSRHTSHPSAPSRKVDVSAPGIKSVLKALADTQGQLVVSEDLVETVTSENEIVVKVSPPVYVRLVPPPSVVAAAPPVTHKPDGRKTTSELIENFMSSWTRLVGDPILSKWIVVILAISISLNGYLLKAIADGGVSFSGAMRLAGAMKGGVRFEKEDEVEEKADDKAVQAKVMPKAAPAPAQRLQPITVPPAPMKFPTLPPPISSPAPAPGALKTFTLEDVDRKLKAAKGVMSPPSSSDSAGSSAEPRIPIEGVRSLEECIEVYENGPKSKIENLGLLNDEEVILLAQNGKIAAYALEKALGMDELERAVRIRRALISRASNTQTLESSDIPLTNYDYSRVLGACCENVIGYIPIPLGVAGPLNVDGTSYHIPMATAEGTLVASTSRGCKALNAGGGVNTVLLRDAMTRGPAMDFPSIRMAAEAAHWIESEEGYTALREAFESTSRFAKLRSLMPMQQGRTLYVRFATATGDAMGMNMISKGTEKALEALGKQFPEMVVLALSGNICTDKKPAAINWILGRGKSVVAEAVVPGKVVQSVLKTTVEALCHLNLKKNMTGSAMAGSIGGFNAHAANILTAIFLATGQDPAQNVESSMCFTEMLPVNGGKDLLISVTMPCIEVGTVGGGTVLAPQGAVLEMLGIKGAHPTHPGQNAQLLARIIASAVMAGELSLMSALAAGHLIRAHMAHNRSQLNTPAASRPTTPGVESASAAASLPPQTQISLASLTPSSSTASLPPYSLKPTH